MDHAVARYVRSIGDEELKERAEELYLAFQVAWLATVYPGILGLELGCLALLFVLITGAGWPAAVSLSILLGVGTAIASAKSGRYAAKKRQEGKRISDQVEDCPALLPVLLEFCAREDWIRRLWKELSPA